MDHHAMMWDAATRDLNAENTQAATVNALADLSGVRDFTHTAATVEEYRHRAALAADRVTAVCHRWGADPQQVQQELDSSYRYVLTARAERHRQASAQRERMARQAASSAPPPPAQPSATPEPPAPDAGAPSEPPAPETTAKTAKPRTMPTGAPTPIPVPVAPGVAPGPAATDTGPAAPGAQAAPPGAPGAPGASKTASRREQIEADIAALNPHLPPTTIARLAKAALRHIVAAEPLAYGNWDNAPDGPITRSIKNWSPPTGRHHSPGGDGLAPDAPEAPDDSPAGPAAAGTAAAAAAPATSDIADALSTAASTR